jgi:hypothetical protein
MFDMKKKGVISILELVAVVITLFLSFSIFFPKTDYKNRWDDAYTILKSRDTTLLLERTGKLHTYAFDQDLMEDFFDTMFPESNLILWYETEGTIKSQVMVACDCTDDAISQLYEWMDDLKLNERNITLSFCSANLDSPDMCIQGSDVLLISGYRDLQSYEQLINDYISKGKGIVEVVDFESEDQMDTVQTNVFGLQWNNIEAIEMDYVQFEREPEGSADVLYEIYKYFYHMPLPLDTGEGSLSIPDCSYNPAKNGTFSFRGTDYRFWACDQDSAWFDTDGDSDYDILVSELEEVTIGGYDFTLNYVNNESSIGISFNPDYVFDDYLSYVSPGGIDEGPAGDPGSEWKTPHIVPADGETERVLMASISTSPSREYPSVIVNKVGNAQVAWVSGLGEGGLWDDEKALLMSLILWSSNKKYTSEVSDIRMGYLTSYVNIKNRDMLEIYKFSLGLGHPF